MTLFGDTTGETLRSALISADGQYRYWLKREWDEHTPSLAWIMLNPSTADATVDDPTIRRVVSFSKREGYGGCVVVNVFALRATSPKRLMQVDDPIGPDNDRHIDEQTAGRTVICAWGGSIPDYWRHRGRSIAHQLDSPIYVLGMTRGVPAQPKHPLYIHGRTKLERWHP